ncbi:MAG: endolytic transglycosylase MltG [Desulfovibrionaceae bacterium]
MKKILYIFLGLVTAASLGMAGYVYHQWRAFLTVPPQSPGHEVVFSVPPGATFDKVTRLLADNDLITDPEFFRLLGEKEHKFGSIQAGEFELHTNWTPERILETLVAGRPIQYRLSIREGLTWWETAEVIEKAGFAPAADFAKVIKDPLFLREHGIPHDTAEGYLFPETYYLTRAQVGDAQAVADLLVKSFWKQAAKIWPGGLPDAAAIHNVVTLASVVEKETGNFEERPMVAGVFTNRLKRRMALQSCATVIYGLGTIFDGNLTKKHLEDKTNPYNTYRHPGLPRTPICSPGLAALQAAAHPDDHKFLYFVSKKDGTHYFSKTLAEHNAAVRKYQLRR